ncbi:MAG TPA: MarR family transcriptional regulator [Acidimicrobiales bacterium]|nr:MarR family transcriptional regulator [Acidimicrobiales bacterium]
MTKPECDPKQASDPLEREILAALQRLLRQMNHETREALKPYGLPPPYARALHQIDGEVSMKELAARMCCDPSFVTGIADRLEEAGLAHRQVDPSDRRVKTLVLTDKGRDVRARLAHDWFGNVRRVRRLDKRQQAELLPLLGKLIDDDGFEQHGKWCGCVRDGDAEVASHGESRRLAGRERSVR